MKTYSSSAIRYFDRHCPLALRHYEEGTPHDREVFATGVAAHAMIQGLCEYGITDPRYADSVKILTVLDAVAKVLIEEGRTFAGRPEPPLSPTSVFAGRDIVLNYCQWNGQIPVQDFSVEHGLAIDAEGNPVDYGSGVARWQAVMDAVEHYDAEMKEDGTVMEDHVLVWEYKTAWPTDEEELETIQTRGHAVLVHAHWPEKAIARRVVNLRTGKHFEDWIYPDDERLEIWRKDILATCDAADRTREARPGAGCQGCPWVLSCDAALWHLKLDAGDVGSAGQAASIFAVVDAIRQEHFKLAKGYCAEDPQDVPGGMVGYKGQNVRKLAEGAVDEIALEWFRVQSDEEEAFKADNSEWMSLLHALGIGASQVDSVCKALLPDRGSVKDREDLINRLTVKETQARFGVYKS